MGKLNNNKINCRGFSTIEMMISLAIATLILSAVVMVSFSNQSILVDSQTNSEALNIAQGLLEKAQTDGRKDFNLVNPFTTSSPDGFYTEKITVEQTGFFTKLVTSVVSWPTYPDRHLKISVPTLVTNFNNAIGGDTCSSVLLPDAEAWKNPIISKKFSDFSSLTGISDNYPITDIDAYKNKLYVTIGKTTVSNSPTFFVFNINNNEINKIDENFVDNNTSLLSGLSAVTVAEDPASTTIPKKTYAYVASGSSKQLQVIDVSTTTPTVVSSLSLAGVSSHGNSIFYKDGFIYLGLKSSTSGPELHIIDVHTPTSPYEVGHWPASGSLNNDINSIYVRGGYAYLSTPDTKNLIILDIGNVSLPVEVGSYNDGGSNHGKSIFLAGDVLYLGRTIGGTELSILDESNPATTTPIVFGKKEDINKSIDDIIVRGKLNIQIPQLPPLPPALAFLLTPSNFTILNVSEANNISPWAAVSLPAGTFGNGTIEPTLDCEGNNFFVGSNDNGDNGYLSIIKP